MARVPAKVSANVNGVQVRTGRKAVVTPPVVVPPVVPAASSVLEWAQARGSVPVGQASYPIQASGVIYVNYDTGVDTNAGTTEGTAVKTMARAAALAPTNGMIVGWGDHHYEGAVFTSQTDNFTKAYQALSTIRQGVTLQNFPGRAWWFDGSKVMTAWTADGTMNGLPVWSTAWSHLRRDPYDRWATDAAYANAVATNDYASLDDPDNFGVAFEFLDTSTPESRIASRPERAWITSLGVETTLKQTDDPALMTTTSFLIDAQTNKLYIAQNPSGKTVRVTALQTLMNLLNTNITARGFGFKRYAASQPQGGVLKIHRADCVLENVWFEDISGCGINGVSSPTNNAAHRLQLRKITGTRIGNVGLSHGGCDAVVYDNINLSYYDDKLFKHAPAAGGVKATKFRGFTMSNFYIHHGYGGKGYWSDQDTAECTLVNGVFQANDGNRDAVGELSANFRVINVAFLDSANDAAFTYNTSGAEYWNCTFRGQGRRRGVTYLKMTFSSPTMLKHSSDNRSPRGNGAYPDGIDSRSGNYIPAWGTLYPLWEPYGNKARNCVFGYPADAFSMFDTNDDRPAGTDHSFAEMLVDHDYCVYNRDTSKTGMTRAFGVAQIDGSRNGSTAAYSTLATFRTATGQDAHSLEVTGRDVLTTDGAVKSSERAALDAAAVPLPADIAALIGVPTGTQRSGFIIPGSVVPQVPSNLAVWSSRASVATVASPARIAVLSDSTGFGADQYGTSDDPVAGKSVTCYPGRLHTLLAASYGDPGKDLVVANVNTNGIRAFPSRDPRWKWIGTITNSTTTTIIACYHRTGAVRITAGSQNYAEYTETCTSFRTHVLNGTAGVVTVTIDNGPLITLRNVIGSSSAVDYDRRTDTHPSHIVTDVPAGALGQHTIRVWGSGGDVDLMGIGHRKNNGGRFMVDNPSISGKSLGSFMASDETNGRYGLPLLDTLRADLLIMGLMINDWQGGTALATVKAQLATITDRQRQWGDILFLLHPVSDITQFQPAGGPTWDQYRAAYAEVATTKGVELVDFSYLWGPDWATGNAAGYYGDHLHNNDKGAASIAAALRPRIGI